MAGPGMNPLHWRPDEFGTPDRALYFRGLYAGEVREAPESFRPTGKPWRAWAQTLPDARDIGWYHTEDEAKAEVQRAVGEQGGEGDTRTLLCDSLSFWSDSRRMFNRGGHFRRRHIRPTMLAYLP